MANALSQVGGVSLDDPDVQLMAKAISEVTGISPDNPDLQKKALEFYMSLDDPDVIMLYSRNRK